MPCDRVILAADSVSQRPCIEMLFQKSVTLSPPPHLHLLIPLQHARLHNLDILDGPILGPRAHLPHALDGAEPGLDAAKDGVLAVEPGRGREGDEELGAVGVGPRVGHAEDARARVLERRVDLVLELVAVDGGAAAARARRVAALHHEVGDDAVEDGRRVVAAADERGEVVARLGGVRGVELERDGDDIGRHDGHARGSDPIGRRAGG
ncbi:hypothetical protein VFPBJ_00189 [Purpureocillium lilacinum]|uniref:Uncharacterized protein n=1 Tax=Purpureocillium lilacinum TaxID=33203 RepID=A0A179H9P4_PURLI|nr:hypothetical protein VFPBJ_00189 [Purpureocillium lilacinum]